MRGAEASSAGGADAVYHGVDKARILFRCAGWMSLRTRKWQEDSMPLPFSAVTLRVVSG